MSNFLSKEYIKQFIGYVFVGGVAAIVEWTMFCIFANIFDIKYLFATALAFVFSTTTNWLLGRNSVFKNSEKYKGKRIKECLMVFLVSGIGLLFNIGLMYLFVTVMGLDTSILMVLSKIIATGIVFVWNFLARKLLIYKI